MTDNVKERKPWTDSDRALAYVIFRSMTSNGIRIGEKQCKAIARSRIVARTDGSWSRKLTNYTQANRYLKGEIREPVYTGNAEKREFPELEELWRSDPSLVLAKASEEIIIRDDEALELFRSMGFADDSMRRGDSINFDLVSRQNVISAVSEYSQGIRPDGYKDSTEYDLLYKTTTYPPKMIMGMAYKLATGQTITGAMFDGGLNTPCFKRYEELGFNIVPKSSGKPITMKTNQKLACASSAKPFTILAGGTGTGKTRSAKLMAASIAGRDNVEVVAVGADWTDNRPLLGFRNLLAEGGKTYVAPPALRIILKALDNPGKPHFLILDEMNLSHVERYFADFLSSMESKEPLKLHDSAEDLKTEDGILVKGKVEWPSNLFVIGTVNIDETTYMFSPKVLDRAHVIEFKVPWDEIKAGLDDAVPSEVIPLTEAQVAEFMRVAALKDKALTGEDHDVLVEVLGAMHEALDGTRFVFAHRTARECLNFIASAKALAAADIVPAQDTKALIDLAILQKALPKLNGAAGTLSKVLDDLIKVADNHDLDQCKAKLESMSRQLKADQFVSFIQ